MKTLTTIHFQPQQDKAFLAFRESGFGGRLPLTSADLTSEEEAAKDAGVAWLLAIAGQAGFSSISDIWLTRKSDVVTEWSEPEDEEEQPEPIATNPAFKVGIWGTNSAGLIGGTEIDSVPGAETTDMGTLWTALESRLNPE